MKSQYTSGLSLSKNFPSKLNLPYKKTFLLLLKIDKSISSISLAIFKYFIGLFLLILFNSIFPKEFICPQSFFEFILNSTKLLLKLVSPFSLNFDMLGI